MSRRSKLLRVLRLAEDFLIKYHRYFEKKSWVYNHSGLSSEKRNRSKKYLQKIGDLGGDLSINLSEKSVYELIPKPWDGKWRIVCFDIPEENKEIRNQLRREIKRLGFRSLQRSVWISPLPVGKYIDKIRKKLDDPLVVSIVVGELRGVKPADIVKQLWNLDSWKNECRNLIKKMQKEKEFSEKVASEFWDLIEKHPKVPIEILPNDWPLNRLVSLFTAQTEMDD